MTLRERLKHATASLHEDIERASPLAREDLTLEEYRLALQTLWGYYSALEPQLEGVFALAASPLSRKKVPWLAADLDSLNDGPTQHRVSALGGSVPRVECLGSALGCAYVLEGATLGGRVLYRRFSTRWGLSAERGARFVYGYGERTGEMWRQFVDTINSVPLDGAGEAACVRAARATFTTLQHRLELTAATAL